MPIRPADDILKDVHKAWKGVVSKAASDRDELFNKIFRAPESNNDDGATYTLNRDLKKVKYHLLRETQCSQAPYVKLCNLRRRYKSIVNQMEKSPAEVEYNNTVAISLFVSSHITLRAPPI